jgi:hypothetical protein
MGASAHALTGSAPASAINETTHTPRPVRPDRNECAIAPSSSDQDGVIVAMAGRAGSKQ